jgi:hypothetical protein
MRHSKQLQRRSNVKVSINLRGREWINPQGNLFYFNTIQGCGEMVRRYRNHRPKSRSSFEELQRWEEGNGRSGRPTILNNKGLQLLIQHLI